MNCRDKAIIFNEFFSKQCKPITNSNVLPTFNFLTIERIDKISIQISEIISLIRNLNITKASGSVKCQMVKCFFCVIILSFCLLKSFLRIFFNHPCTLKCGNLQTLQRSLKRVIINILKTIGQYPYFQFVVKCLKYYFQQSLLLS